MPHAQHNVAIYLPNVTKFQKFVNWKLKKFVTYTRRKFLPAWTFVTSSRRLKYIYQNSLMKTHSYRHFLLTLSCQVRTKGHTNLKKPAVKICFNVRDLLLPPGINGVNSHKIILWLIISCINYWNAILIFYLRLDFGEMCSSDKVFCRVMFSPVRFPEDVFSGKLVKSKVFAGCL